MKGLPRLFKFIHRLFVMVILLALPMVVSFADHNGSTAHGYNNNPPKFSNVPKFDGFDLDYRKKWSRITGYEYSGLHWKQFVVIYVNGSADIYRNNYQAYLSNYTDDDDYEDGSEVIESEFEEYPEGTIFIKEHYLNNEGHPGVFNGLSIMTKRKKGYDPEFGDWEYTYVDAQGRITEHGNSNNAMVNSLCVNCHANLKERDYVFSTFYSASPHLE